MLPLLAEEPGDLSSSAAPVSVESMHQALILLERALERSDRQEREVAAARDDGLARATAAEAERDALLLRAERAEAKVEALSADAIQLRAQVQEGERQMARGSRALELAQGDSETRARLDAAVGVLARRVGDLSGTVEEMHAAWREKQQAARVKRAVAVHPDTRSMGSRSSNKR